MSLRFRLLSIVVVALGITGVSFAQDTKPTDPATQPQVERPQRPDRQFKGDRREFGKREFGKRGFGRGGPGMEFRGLNLTDAQKEQMRTIGAANKPDKAVMEEFRTIGEARRAGTITDAQKARATEIREQMRANGKSVHEQMLNVLTADQKAQLEKQRAEMKERRQDMRKRFEERRKNRVQTPATTPVAPPANPIN